MLYKCWRARKATCAKENDRTLSTSGRLLMDDRSSCRCSCTKDWYSALHASTSLPLVQPFSRSPSKSLLNSWRGTTSSPTTTNAGQKQLIPCPVTDLEATVDRTQFPNSSRKRRASRRNSIRRYELPTFSNAAITRVPERKSFSSIAGNREWFGTTYSSHYSTGGKNEAFLIFCSKQSANRANSSKAWYPWTAAVEEWTKYLATETDTSIIDMTTETPSPTFVRKIHPRRNLEPSWKNASVSLEIDEQNLSGPTTCPWKISKECMGLLTEFKRKMQQTELHPRHFIQLEKPVNSLLLYITDTKNPRMKMQKRV